MPQRFAPAGTIRCFVHLRTGLSVVLVSVGVKFMVSTRPGPGGGPVARG